MGHIVQLHGKQAEIFREWLAYYRKLKRDCPWPENEPNAIDRTNAFINAKQGSRVPGAYWGALEA